MSLEAWLLIFELGRVGLPAEHPVSKAPYSTMNDCVVEAAEFNRTQLAVRRGYYASCRVKEAP